MNILILVLIVGARLIVPLWIPRFPLPAIIAALILDGIDGGVFAAYTTLSMENYQSYDKALDIYYLTIAYLAAVRNWTNLNAIKIAAFLFYYRLLGVLLFEIFEYRALLFIFPNTFEYFFILYEAARLRWNLACVSIKTLVGAAAAIWIAIKLPQEYWIHIAQRDVTDTLGEFPVLIPILAVVIAAILGVGYWAVTRRMPPAHHAPSFAAGDPIPLDVMKQAMLRYRSLSWRLQGLWEKVVLVALISANFAMIIPGTAMSGLEMAIGVAIVVVLNTIVSELLTRKGLLTVHDIGHFFTMVGVNMVLAWIGLSILPEPASGNPFRIPNMLFFFFLISLLVTLFDRFRALAILQSDTNRTAALA